MKKGWERGWKVLRKEKGKLISPVLGGNSPGKTRYYFRRPTAPNRKCGPLCVFQSLQEARCFCKEGRTGGGGSIYLCWFKPSKAQLVYYPRGLLGQAITPLQQLPVGTRLATQVVILSKKEIE